jgi:tRNA modification GTPase
LYVIDGVQGIHHDDVVFLNAHAGQAADHPASLILLWNKADIAPLPEDAGAIAIAGTPLAVSAVTGAGLAELSDAIVKTLEQDAGSSDATDHIGLGSGRQKDLVDSACMALTEALNMADRDEALDLIAPCLREAVNSLGEITGEVSTADILETIFSKFCVGK